MPGQPQSYDSATQQTQRFANLASRITAKLCSRISFIKIAQIPGWQYQLKSQTQRNGNRGCICNAQAASWG